MFCSVLFGSVGGLCWGPLLCGEVDVLDVYIWLVVLCDVEGGGGAGASLSMKISFFPNV